MSNPPTGRLFPIADGHDLVLSCTFRAPIEDVWASVTESDRTARWFGAWEGDAAPGHTIKLQMAYEDQSPWFDVRIDACEPPRRLALSTTDEAGNWRIELRLSQTDGHTELQLVHHLDNTDQVGEMGPGWEYYLDMLVAARDGSPTPSFDDYYPAMKPYYDSLPAEAAPA
ncbi:SRPBCC family protein [Micromonospora musae]|uniref:SRPBCC family protein n=1 Tax=Micromonospora musae TaxID=1894970 RepID=UPI003432C9A7